MRGNITRRGKRSWRLKFDVGTGSTPDRLCHGQGQKEAGRGRTSQTP
jgi:hypothetical protein